ncbi:MAG: hypothetical protein R2792_06040 [Saprospiraceae bacterium]
MKLQKQVHTLGLYCTALLCGLVFLFYFNAHYFNPDRVLMDYGFDGFKNYFTFGYFVKHGNGLNFEGMAYPNGDNIVFADAQPAISYPLQLLTKVWPNIGSNTTLIINYLMFLSVVLGAVSIFKIFQYYKLGIFQSILFSVLIALFSPQIFRMPLHHSLAYVFVIPTTLWIHLRAVEIKQRSWDFVALSVWGIGIAFIHSYYLLMFGLYLGGYYLVRYFLDKKFRPGEYLSVLAPFVFFLVYLWLFDGLADRPSTAWGFFEFRARLETLFLPHTGPFADYLNEQFPTLKLGYCEGSAYLGIAGCLGFLALIAKGFRKNQTLSVHQKAAVLGVLPITLFALQIPFVWMGEEVVSSIPVLQQFRGSGRFAWFFYFVILIYGFIELLQLLARVSNWYVNRLLLLCLLGLMAVEADFHLASRKKVFDEFAGYDVLQRGDALGKLVQENGFKPGDFKSVLCIPPSTTGSEKIRLYDDFHIKMAVWPFAFQAGIPTTAINLSRTPAHTVLESLALCCNEYTPKPKNLQIDTGNHLVVMRDYAYADYAWLRSISKKIGEHETWGVFVVNSTDLMGQHTMDLDSVSDLGSEQYLLFDAFDKQEGTGVSGPGLLLKGEARWEVDLPKPVPEAEFSFWYRLQAKNTDVIEMQIRVYDTGGNLLGTEVFSDQTLIKFEVLDNWIRFAKKIPLPEGSSRLELRLISKYAYIDNLMVRGTRDTVYFRQGAFWNFNNNLVPVK